VNFTIKASIYLSQATRLSVDFITYFTVIHTKTYTSHVSTWSKSISDKIAAKKRRTPSKIFLLGLKTTFRHIFPSRTCNVCPLAIPEFFAHKSGIRLVANHSLTELVGWDGAWRAQTTEWSQIRFMTSFIYFFLRIVQQQCLCTVSGWIPRKEITQD